MPLRYKIIESKKLVYVIGDGKITLDDLLNHLDELSEDARYIGPMKKLVDYRQAMPMGPKSEDLDLFVSKMLRLKDIFAGEKCAIVVNDNLSFGISRIYDAKIYQSKIETNIFRDFNKALQWLDIQLDGNETCDG